MRKLLLLALPLASLLFVIGCDEQQASASSTPSYAISAPAPAPSAPAQAAAPAPAVQSSRTTTQALPQGWNYIHDKDLANGPLNARPAANPNGG